MITRMDRDIARLTTRLGELGLDDRTLIMFVSDNGPHREGGADPAFFKSAGGLRGIKRDLYEGGIRVPMIARWRGTIPAGRVSDHVWAHWDMLPTLSELAGAKTPPAIDGLSMTRALRGQPQPTHDFLYWEFHERGFQQAVRAGRWKAVRLAKAAPLELYDLESDPHEERDVAAGNPGVVAKIEQYLRSARTESARWVGEVGRSGRLRARVTLEHGLDGLVDDRRKLGAFDVDRLVDANVEHQVLRRCRAHLDADHADEVARHFVCCRLFLGVDVPPDHGVVGDESVARSLCHLREPEAGELALDRRDDLAINGLVDRGMAGAPRVRLELGELGLLGHLEGNPVVGGLGRRCRDGQAQREEARCDDTCEPAGAGAGGTAPARRG